MLIKPACVETESGPGALTQRVRSGAAWYMGVRIASIGVGICTLPIIARLLRPEDYGLMGIVSIALYVSDVVSRTGFDGALIARSGPVDEYLPSMWSAELLRGAAQCLVLMLLAYPAALFYRDHQLVALLAAASLYPVLRSFQSAGVTLLHKEMAFRQVALYEGFPVLIGAVATVAFALWWRNVWSLLAGQLFTALIAVFLSYYLAPFTPRFVFRPDHWRTLWRYGRWEMLSSIFYVLFYNGDDMFVGRVLGMPALGLYRMAYRLGNSACTEGVDVVRRVLFPAFARIQTDPARLRKAFLVFWEASSILGMAFLSISFFALQPLVQTVFGSKWLAMVPALRVLVVWGGLEVLNSAVSSVFRAINRPDWWTKILMIRVVIMAATIYPLSIRWGIAGAACAPLIAALCNLPVTFRWLSQSVHCSVFDLLRPLLLPLASGLAALIAGAFASHAIQNASSVSRLFGITMTAGLGFVAVLFTADRIFKTGLHGRLLRATGRQ